MKDELEKLLDEIKERMDYYLKKADNENLAEFTDNYVGHYAELKRMKESLEEILNGKDGNLY